jgi:quinoprotein glucose dehydrogenase
MRKFLACPAALLAGILVLGAAIGEPEDVTAPRPNAPRVAAASKEGVLAIRRFQVPRGLRVDLVAAEPLLANPVAFCFDEKGRIYVAETFRLHHGVTDNRGHGYWLKDDLSARKVADRVALYRKYHGKTFRAYTEAEDRVRLLEDTDGDGVMDRATVFADGFNAPADGLGAGVLARGGKVWYTNIPSLWLLEDTKGGGKADVKKALQTGYGVHVSFIGHDLHGLTFGPDGKLYFSIGDRGLNVKTADRTAFCPDSGAVLRCNPDGSELEVVATGLRNPQKLAFDKYGNLFTCDNNADSGDAARWVYVVEGGDSGWRIGYQYLRGPGAPLGPWNAEKLWHLAGPGDAAYRLPPLAHVANGPSGLTYDPGTGLLPARYRDHFFLVDFRGSSGGSGIHAFKVRPRGAAFELVEREHFLWGVLATDTDFGPDGALYCTDWVEGWNLTGKGRIYKVYDPARLKDATAAEVKRLLAEGFARRSVAELVKLLGHADRRVRQEAQFALAAKGPAAIEPLAAVARRGGNRLARLHAIWGLGQLVRGRARAALDLVPLLKDGDAEVRAQAARVLAGDRDPAGSNAAEKLLPLLKDPEPRVRFFAALSLGKIGGKSAVGPVLDMLRHNGDADAYLRHAGVMALVGLNDHEAILAASRDASPSVRLASLLAMRRLEMPEVGRFLGDADGGLVLEASRAVNDVPIDPALPQLAALAPRTGLAAPVLYRVISAHYRLGKRENAADLVALAARPDVLEAVRIEALRALGDWGEARALDRVVNLWRPASPRRAEDAAGALRSGLGGIFSAPDRVRAEGAGLAARFGIREVGPALLALVAERARSPQVRVETLRALAALKDARLDEALKLALADEEPRLRAAGRRVLAGLRPAEALPELEKALERGTTVERQQAFATLGGMKVRGADPVLARWLDRLLAGKVAPEVRLDLLEAAGRRPAAIVTERLARYDGRRARGDHLANYREALVGGDASAGRRIFFERSDVACVRCHKVDGVGGEVGPDLTGIGKRQPRDYLLESVVDPNRQIAKGYETVVLVLTDGQMKTGILKAEDAQKVQLMTPEGALVSVPKADIDERTRGKSAMPEDLVRSLSRLDVRDLVEFLSSLK